MSALSLFVWNRRDDQDMAMEIHVGYCPTRDCRGPHTVSQSEQRSCCNTMRTYSIGFGRDLPESRPDALLILCPRDPSQDLNELLNQAPYRISLIPMKTAWRSADGSTSSMPLAYQPFGLAGGPLTVAGTGAALTVSLLMELAEGHVCPQRASSPYGTESHGRLSWFNTLKGLCCGVVRGQQPSQTQERYNSKSSSKLEIGAGDYSSQLSLVNHSMSSQPGAPRTSHRCNWYPSMLASEGEELAAPAASITGWPRYHLHNVVSNPLVPDADFQHPRTPPEPVREARAKLDHWRTRANLPLEALSSSATAPNDPERTRPEAAVDHGGFPKEEFGIWDADGYWKISYQTPLPNGGSTQLAHADKQNLLTFTNSSHAAVVQRPQHSAPLSRSSSLNTFISESRQVVTPPTTPSKLQVLAQETEPPGPPPTTPLPNVPPPSARSFARVPRQKSSAKLSSGASQSSWVCDLDQLV